MRITFSLTIYIFDVNPIISLTSSISYSLSKRNRYFGSQCIPQYRPQSWRDRRWGGSAGRGLGAADCTQNSAKKIICVRARKLELERRETTIFVNIYRRIGYIEKKQELRGAIGAQGANYYNERTDER